MARRRSRKTSLGKTFKAKQKGNGNSKRVFQHAADIYKRTGLPMSQAVKKAWAEFRSQKR